MSSEAVLEKIRSHVSEKGSLPIANGGFGDMEDCTGLVEEVLTPEEGGTYIKFYGCEYLFKGFPEQNVVEGLGLAKAMISALPREIFARSWTMLLALGWTFLFQRRKFIHLLHVYFSAIYANEVAKVGIPEIRYNRVPKELKRAVYAVLNREFKPVKDENGVELGILHRDFSISSDKEILELVAKVTEFICLFLELDSAYRFRIQDALGELDKNNLKKSVVKELDRVAGIMLQRENGIKPKIVHAKRLLKLFLILSPKMRRLTRDFLLELDLEKVSLDEADWYFCLRRNNYNFGGLPVEERVKEKERIDKEKGHVALRFRDTETRDEKGNIRRGYEISVI